MRKDHIESHFAGTHPNFVYSPVEYFEFVRDVMLDYPEGKRSDTRYRVAYDIAYELVRHKRPHSDTEKLIKPILTSFIHNMMQVNPTELLAKSQISQASVGQKVNAMAANVEEQLVRMLRSAKFSLHLEESRLRKEGNLLMAFARVVNPETGELVEDFLFAQRMSRQRKEEGIMLALRTYFGDHKIPAANLIACSTDSSSDVIGMHRAFFQRLKQLYPKMCTTHDILHRRNLFSKNQHEELYQALDAIIKAVNTIKKRSKSDSLYQKLFAGLGYRQTRLLVCETRWLQTHQLLQNFTKAYDEITKALKPDPHFACLTWPFIKEFVFYIADLFEKLDELNVAAEGGSRLPLLETRARLSTFLSKLGVWKAQIDGGYCGSFPLLSALTSQPKDTTMKRISSHLVFLEKDLKRR